tara:strand:+ start:60 stop:443 length:384 start_codon:yes stop_codon:yes gene_type:complete
MSNSLRIDRWLWFARFFKSRSLAAKACVNRKVRMNGSIVAKSNQQVKSNDILTFPQGREIRIVRVLGLGIRRGPAAEAQSLFEDLTKRSEKGNAVSRYNAKQTGRADGTGRPTKADRRAIIRFMGKE